MTLYQALDKAHFTVTVLSREEAIRQADSFGKDTCVISITTPGKTNVSFPCDTLHVAFYDTTEILDNPNYFINARCYAYVLMAFGIDVTEEDITTARERSKKAYLSNWP